MQPSYIVLRNLRDLRKRAELQPRQIEAITAARRIDNPASPLIPISRLSMLEHSTRPHEPTYAEALALARVLLLDRIAPLVDAAGDIYAMGAVLGPLRNSDAETFRLSRDIGLSVACRIAVSLGLDDPMQLEQLPIHAQLWDIIGRNERGAEPGQCPWCLADISAGEDHRHTCIPQGLFAPWNRGVVVTAELPRPGQPRTRGEARFARGLRLARVRAGLTQKDLGGLVETSPNYLSRIERCSDRLTDDLATRIAKALDCPHETLFAAP